MRYIFSFLCFLLAQTVPAQHHLVSEDILLQVTKLSATLPSTINEAYQQATVIKTSFDSLEGLITQAYPVLADKMKKRSARLNSMAGYNVTDATLSLMPPNQKMTNFFLAEWDKLDNLERAFNNQAPSFFGSKELYKAKGYLAVWDSVYKKRLPALVKYRDAVFKLVQAEIAYLKANGKMFSRSNEDERMQWVEAELGVLQKLVLLGSKYKKLVITDGVEKVQYCKTYPESCQKAN